MLKASEVITLVRLVNLIGSVAPGVYKTIVKAAHRAHRQSTETDKLLVVVEALETASRSLREIIAVKEAHDELVHPDLRLDASRS